MRTERKKYKVIAKQIPTRTSITCGTENPASLGCTFYELESGEIAAPFTCGPLQEGHEGIMHGGFTAAVLDEAMGRANRICCRECGEYDVPFFTAEMTVKYLKPVLRGAKMVAYARVERKDGRKRYACGEIIDENGEIMATATGLYISVKINDDNLDYSRINGGSELTEDDPEEL